MKRQFVKLLLFILFTGGSCNKDYIPDHYSYIPPTTDLDGLEVSSLEEEGFNTGTIEYMINYINAGKYVNLHSILILRNDKLIFEEYFQGYNRNSMNNLYSVTKSFCSALVGIAIDNHFIESVDDPIKKYLPEYSNIDWTGKEGITIRHLLTMSAGLEWDEGTANYGTPQNSHTKMSNSPDQVKYVLERPVVAKPGTKFVYNSGLPDVLSKIVINSSRLNFDTLATRYLFKPLGIKNHSWYIYPSGIYHTGGDLKITSRDMAKFGLLYLNHGKWNGRQIISEEWIEQSTTSWIKPWLETYYGYMWWKKPILLPDAQRINGYFAEGFGGQLIFVLPSFNMVVVFTSGINWNDEGKLNQPIEILQQFILPAISR